MRKLMLMILSVLAVIQLIAADYYVSANGKGKEGSKESPAKDLGNIISKLVPGDTVHIAGGEYLGRGKNGSDVIDVPVKIIGGYDEEFKTRDPWGKYKTIFTGENESKNWVATPRLLIDLNKYKGKEMPEIVVDGIIIDHGGRNHYKTEEQLEIIRKANPKTGKNPTPDMGALVIVASKTGNFTDAWNITVQNCIVTNAAPTQGAMSVSGYEKSKITIRNNIVVNNTGSGIVIDSKYHPKEGKNLPEFLVENNTVLFTWKYDSFAQSFSGNSIKIDMDTVSTMKNNVFGFADKYGVYNASKSNILLQDNLIVGNIESDYLEFNTRIDVENLEDEAEQLHKDSGGNVNQEIKVPVSNEWAKNYAGRVLIDRNAVEADIKVQATRANQVRSMLGLPLQAGNVKTPESPVWLNRLSIEDAVNSGKDKYLGKYGASMP